MTAQLESLPTARDGKMGALLMLGEQSAWLSLDQLRDLWAKTQQAQTDRALDQMEEEQEA